MPAENPDILYLRDENGDAFAVQLSMNAWAKVEEHVLAVLSPATKEAPPPEPMADWEMLVQYWDFKYPVNTEAHCDLCGAHTEDWTADDPRKFRLKAANLGGLVSFTCLACNARVTKKFFKDHFTYEATPHFDKKDPKLNAVYSGG